jgi:hypothetical protein
MSLALDYMGKFIIVMVVVGVVISILLGMQSDFSQLPFDTGNNNSDTGNNEIVEASNAGDVADFVDICVSDTVDAVSDLNCFVIRHPDSSFSLDKSSIESEIESEDVEVKFLDNTYNREIITVRYDVSRDKVVIEK